MKTSFFELLLSDLEDPSAIVEDLWVFRHWVVARTGRYAVVSIPNATTTHLCRGKTDISTWIGKRVTDVVLEGMSSGEVVRRAAAMACLNASVRVAKSAFEGNAMSPFSELVQREPSCFIGHFEEAARWREAGHPVTIVELEPKPGDVHWEDADAPLRAASLVFLTGLTLLNGTFEQVVARTPNARLRILMGPTVPASERLLGMGVHLVGGTIVEDPERLLRYFQYGGTSIKKVPDGAISRFNIVDSAVKSEVSHVA